MTQINISTPNILDGLKDKLTEVINIPFRFNKESKFNPSFLNQELTKEQAWYHSFKMIILKETFK